MRSEKEREPVKLFSHEYRDVGESRKTRHDSVYVYIDNTV